MCTAVSFEVTSIKDFLINSVLLLLCCIIIVFLPLSAAYWFRPRFAGDTLDCFLQLLVDWCTHALTGFYNGKVDFSQMVLEGLWGYLDDLLHSRKLHSFLKQGKTISLRLNVAQVSKTLATTYSDNK